MTIALIIIAILAVITLWLVFKPKKAILTDYPKPVYNDAEIQGIIETNKREKRERERKVRTPPVPKVIPKTIQQQIDEEYERLNSKPGVGGESFKIKLSENWGDKKKQPEQDDTTLFDKLTEGYVIGVDPYRKDDDTEPSAVTVFGGGSFGGAGASGDWREDEGDKSHNSSDTSDDNDGYQTTDKSEGGVD